VSGETHTLRLNIDASKAEAGARSFIAAMGKIKRAANGDVRKLGGEFRTLSGAVDKLDASKLNKFESSLKSFKNVGKGARNFRQFADALKSLRVPSDKKLQDLTRLSDAVKSFRGINGSVGGFADLVKTLSTFKAPSERHVKGVRDLFFAIGQYRAPSNLSSLGDMSRILSGMRIPSSGKLERFKGFLRVMQSARAPRGNMAGYSQLSAVFSKFRAPSRSQTENLRGFLKMLDNIRAPRHVRAVAEAMNQIAVASNRANRTLSRTNQLFRRIPSNAGRAARSFRNTANGARGMENAFSASYQAGSMLRTLLGSLTVAEFSRQLWTANTAALRAETAFRVVTGSVEGANEEFEFTTQLARETGQALDVMLPRYSKFSVAAQMAGFSTENTRRVYASTSAALTVLGASAHDAQLSFLALEQMVSKGTIQSEELRRQLSERLPGAFSAMARAAQNIGLIAEEVERPEAALNDLLRQGKVLSEEILPAFAEELMRTYGSELEAALRRPDTALKTLRTEFFLFRKTVGEAGFMDAVGTQMNRIADVMGSPAFQNFAKTLGEDLAVAINKLGDGVVYVLENIEMFRKIAEGVVWVVFVRTLWGMGGAMISMSGSIRTAIGGMRNMIGPIRNMIVGLRTMTGATTMLGLAMRAIPLIGIVAGLATMAHWLWKNREETVTLAGRTAEIGDIIGGTWDYVTEKASNFFNILQNFGNDVLGFIGDQFGVTFDNINIGWGDVVNFMRGLINFFINWGNSLRTIMVAVFKGIVDSAIAAYGPLVDLIDSVKEGDMGQAFTHLGELNGFSMARRGMISLVQTAEETKNRLAEIWNTDNFAEGGMYGDMAADIMDLAVERGERRDREATPEGPGDTGDGEPSLMDRLFPPGGNGDSDTGDGGDNSETDRQLEQLRDSLQGVYDQYDPLGAAQREYAESQMSLALALAMDVIPSTEAYESALARLETTTRNARDPMAAMQRDMDREIELLRMGERERQIEIDTRNRVNELVAAGVQLHDINNEQLREQVALIYDLNNANTERTGFARFIEDAATFDEILDDISYKISDEISDAFAEMATSGKLSFRDLTQSILADIARAMSHKMVASFLNMLGLGDAPDQQEARSSGSSGGILSRLFGGANQEQSQGGGNFLQRLFGGNQGGNSAGSSMGQDFAESARSVFQGSQGGRGFLNRLGGIFSQGGEGGGFLSNLMGVFRQGGGFFENLFSGIMGKFGGGGGGGVGDLLGMASPLLNMIPGVGPFLSMGAQVISGSLSEGGYSGSAVKYQPVAADIFKNARHFSEGTQNISGGIPSILHPEEAVVPLSRGRKIPVQLTNSKESVSKSDGQGGNVSLNVQIPEIVIHGAKDEESGARAGAAAGRELKMAMKSILAEESRPGGLLYNQRKAS